MRSPGRQRREPETAYRRAFGKRLRELREAQDLSQQHLADSVDMSTRHLGGIERGEHNVTLDLMVRLAAGLGVSPRDLLPVG